MNKETKSQVEALKEQLVRKNEHFSARFDETETEKADAFCEGYKAFLNYSKTERECARFILRRAEAEEIGKMPHPAEFAKYYDL